MRNKDINTLIRNAVMSGSYHSTPLKILFDTRLEESRLTLAQVCKCYEMAAPALESILNGSSEKVDGFELIKIAAFLQIPLSEVGRLHIQAVVEINSEEVSKLQKRVFIREHFDLETLQNEGIVENMDDFEQVEEQINKILGMDSILQYDRT